MSANRPAAGSVRRCLTCAAPGPFDPFFARGKWRLVRCGRCGLVFQDPPPTVADEDQLYYGDPAFTEALEGPLRPVVLRRARHKAKLLEPLTGAGEGRRCLDVGCSSGAWLEVAAEHGWRAIGVEPGPATAAAARARGLSVLTGTLERVEDQLEPGFDLITFWDVLEHLADPLATLAGARRLLSEDGVVAATFPNIAGWYPRVTYRLLARRTGIWEHPELPAHRYDFDPATARLLFERAGYEVVELRTTEVPFDHFRGTTLAPERLGGGGAGRVCWWALNGLRAVVYPLARPFDRGNALFVVARPGVPTANGRRSRAPGPGP